MLLELSQAVELTNDLISKDYTIAAVMLVLMVGLAGFTYLLFNRFNSLVERLFEVIENNSKVVADFHNTVESAKRENMAEFQKLTQQGNNVEGLLEKIRENIVSLNNSLLRLTDIYRHGKGNGN